MEGQPKATQRAPRLGQTPGREKAEALRAALPKELARLKKLQPTRAKESPALASLRPQRDEILALLRDGWSANAIATELANAHDGLYGVETMRNAIRRLASEESGPTLTRTQPTTTATQKATPGAKPSMTSHAGFAEDPR